MTPTLPARLPSNAPLAALLDEVLDAAVLVTGAPVGNLQVVNPAGALHIVAQRGFAREFLDFFAVVHLDGSACAAALRDHRPVVVTDVATDPNFNDEARAVMLHAHARAVQSTPLVTTAGAVVGVVSTHFDEPTSLSTRRLDLVARFARQAASLIERRSADGPHRSEAPRLGEIVRDKLRANLLPRDRSGKLWAGYGQGAPCSACGLPVSGAETEYEIDVDGRTYRLHIGCFVLWERERRRRSSADVHTSEG